jgi:hypothetical protein
MTPSRETTRVPKLIAIALTLTMALAGCDSPTLIRGAGLSTYLAGVTVNESHGQLNSGEPPAPSTGPTLGIPSNVQGITGGSSAMTLTASAPISSVVAFVDGVDGFYFVPVDGITSGQAIVTIGGLPPVLDFEIVFAAAGANGIYGPYTSLNVSAIQAAGGDIQVSVTWNSDADVDLHVVEPGGTEIYYGNPTSASGGELDIDANAACAVSGLTQENIGWAAGSAQPGTYTVRVDYWDACGAASTDFIVTISLRPGVPSVPGLPGSGVQIYEGTFTGPGDQGGAGSGRTITTFVF